jgi:hypothetical protein
MTRGFAFSRPLAFGAVAAMAAVCVLFCVRTAKKTEVLDQRRQGGVVEAELSAQITAKSEFETSNLGELRKHAVLFLGSAGTWERVTGRLGSAWIAGPVQRDEKAGCTVQTGTMNLLSHSVRAWPDIISAVRDLESIPGVDVAEFEMKTSGAVDRRSVDVARMLLVVRTAPSAVAATPYP